MGDRGSEKIRSYKDLEVWKKGLEIVDEVYELTKQFPLEERYGLGPHMQRTAVSIPSNIAEGYARQYRKEYLQFCYVSIGSCAELDTQLQITRRRHYSPEKSLKEVENLIDHESRMLMNLIKKLRGLL